MARKMTAKQWENSPADKKADKAAMMKAAGKPFPAAKPKLPDKSGAQRQGFKKGK